MRSSVDGSRRSSSHEARHARWRRSRGIPGHPPRSCTTVPKQKPGRSEQIVVTPFELVDAVEARFGKLRFDLAATRENCRVRSDPSRFYGPGSSRGKNSLKKDWSKRKGLCWLKSAVRQHRAVGSEVCRDRTAEPNAKDRPSRAERRSAATGGREFVDWQGGRVLPVTADCPVRGPQTAGYPKEIAQSVIYSGLKTHSYQCWRWRKI